jgi:hypothetical protein
MTGKRDSREQQTLLESFVDILAALQLGGELVGHLSTTKAVREERQRFYEEEPKINKMKTMATV